VEMARMDFTQMDDGSSEKEKIELAKKWLKGRFPKEAQIVEEKLKYFLSMRSGNSDGYKDTLFIHPLANHFGEYAITAEYANAVKTETLAARLVKAAYTVLYRGQGYSPEMSERLAEEKRKKITKRPAHLQFSAAVSLN